MGSPKLFMMTKFALTKLIENASSQNYTKDTQFPSLSFRYLVFRRFSFYFVTETKTDIFKVILTNFSVGKNFQREIYP